MDNETNTTVEQQEQQQQQSTAAELYVDNINQLKSTTVSKSAYDQLLADNKVLANALANRTFNEDDGNEPTGSNASTTIEDLRTDLFYSNKENGNYDFLTKTLELRDKVIEEQGIDPFARMEEDGTYTQDSLNEAEATAEFFKKALDFADQSVDKEKAIAVYMDNYLIDPPANKINKNKRKN